MAYTEPMLPRSTPTLPRSTQSSPAVFAVMLIAIGLHAGAVWLMVRDSGHSTQPPPVRPITVDMIPGARIDASSASRVAPPVAAERRSPPAPAERDPRIAGRDAPEPAPRPERESAFQASSVYGPGPADQAAPQSASDPASADASAAALAGDFGGDDPDTERTPSPDVAAGVTPAPDGEPVAEAASAAGADPVAAVGGRSEPSDARAPDAPLPIPGPMEGRWRYEIFYGEFHSGGPVAVLDYVMSLGEGKYRLYTEGQARGLLALFYRGSFRQSSAGRLDAGGFRPERYEEQRGDRGARVVSVSVEEPPVALFDDGRRLPLALGVQDRLSLAAHFAWLAAVQSPRLREPSISVELLGVSSTRTLRFQILRDQVLQTNAGTQRLLKLRSEDGDGGSASGSLEIWLREDGGLMPVRIRLEDQRGQVLDQLLVGG